MEMIAYIYICIIERKTVYLMRLVCVVTGQSKWIHNSQMTIVEFFFQLYEFSLYEIYILKIIHCALLESYKNSLIYSQFVSFLKYLLRIYIYGPAVRVFANGPGDLGSIPGWVIPKTLKMELDTTLLNTQHYKVRFKGKVEQSREWSSALPYTLV